MQYHLPQKAQKLFQAQIEEHKAPEYEASGSIPGEMVFIPYQRAVVILHR